MKYFSLFAGIGGFEYGIEEAYNNKSTHISKKPEQENSKQGRKWDTQKREILFCSRKDTPLCIGYSEINKYATAIYRYHYPEHKNYGDATKIISGELPDFDLLVAGFPCQSFSIAGKRKGMSGEDIRGTLFFEIWRIARDKRPRTLLLENVPGLLSSQGGKDFQTILQSLDEIGYDVEWDCLNSKNFGVPQNRQRVFIVGHLRGQSFKKVFPVGENNKSINGIQQKTERTGQGIYSEISETAGNSTSIENRGNGSRRFDSLHGFGHGWQGYHNRKAFRQDMIRRLTSTECERLQAFPDGWTEWGIMDNKKVKISDTQRYKVLGNAVTTSVIKEIIKKMFS